LAAMKKLVFVMILLGFVVAGSAQETAPKKEKQTKAEKRAQKAEEIEGLLTARNFVFRPQQALPTGWRNVQLNFFFDAEIKGDTIISYLPFYGVAYHAEYGGRNSPLSFTKPIENYKIEKDKKGYRIGFEVKNEMDYMTFTFRISETGYASLTVTSVNRQPISYHGIIEPPGEKETAL